MANLAQGWINHLRRQARNYQAAPTDTAAPAPSAKDQPRPRPSDDRPDSVALRDPPEAAPSGDPAPEDAPPARKRFKSPTNSVKAGDRTRSPTPNRRSRGDETVADFPARPAPRTKGRIWNEGDPILTRTPASTQPPLRLRLRRSHEPPAEEEDPSVNTMIGQPETRHISQEQLIAEVKGIYAGLVVVESKCTEVDSSQSARNDSNPKLKDAQWQELIVLHRTLLHEHCDSFLASQHPSAMFQRVMCSPLKSSSRKLPLEHKLPSLSLTDSNRDMFGQDGWLGHGNIDDDENTEHPLLNNIHNRVSRLGSGDGGHFGSPGPHPQAAYLGNLQSESPLPQHHLDPLVLFSAVPRVQPKFLILAALAVIAFPIVSAVEIDVVSKAWVCGIMSTIPSIYFLANPPISPPSKDDGFEEDIWKICGIWGRSLGPVSAVMFIKALRDILPIEKQDKFSGIVFAMWVTVTLLLLLFMKEDTLGVLDLLAPFGTFCGLAAFFALKGPMEKGPGVFRDLEGQTTPVDTETIQPTQTSQAMPPEDEADRDPADVPPYIRNNDAFSIGSDSTGDGESHT